MRQPGDKKWEAQTLGLIFANIATSAWRMTRDNELFLCRRQDSQDEVILEVLCRNACEPGLLAFQFSGDGEVKGILRILPDGRERLWFDRGEGFGDLDWAEEQARMVVGSLVHSFLEEPVP